MGLKLCKGAKGMWKERYGMVKLILITFRLLKEKYFIS